MAYPDSGRSQQFYIGKNPQLLANLLLILNLIGIIVIIIILLWWWPWYWGSWGGARVVGSDGRTISGGPGGVTINACCPSTGTTPCIPPGGRTTPTCEEECKQITGGNQEAYDKCLVSRCGKPGSTCKEDCHNRYPADSLKEAECIRVNCPQPTGSCKDSCVSRYKAAGDEAIDTCIQLECDGGDDCETSCWKRYSNDMRVYRSCVSSECDSCEESCRERYSDAPSLLTQCLEGECGQPQQMPTCEDNCRQQYPNSVTLFQGCVENECLTPYPCEDSCWERYSDSEQLYTLCIQGECNPQQTTTPNCEQQCAQQYGETASTGYNICVQQCYSGGSTTQTSTRSQSLDCRDSDGSNTGTAGTVTFGGQTYRDYCADNQRVNEYVCRNGKPTPVRQTCSGRCQDGRCVASINPALITSLLK
jgi:hypothetical protein